MSSTNVTPGEKAALSQLVRRLVEHRAKTTENDITQIKKNENNGVFSNDGLLLRIVEIEKKVEALSQHRSKTLNTISSTIERLETRISRLDGEINGLQEREEQRDLSVRKQEENLRQSSAHLAEDLFKQIEKFLVRVESLVLNYNSNNTILHSDLNKDARRND